MIENQIKSFFENEKDINDFIVSIFKRLGISP